MHLRCPPPRSRFEGKNGLRLNEFCGYEPPAEHENN
jgi:hypothetical protein